MAIDLGKVDYSKTVESGVEVSILLPNGDESGIIICVAGRDSLRHRTAMRLEVERRKTLKTNTSGTEEERNEIGKAVVSNCVLRWSGIVWDGKELECTEENVRKVFDAHEWLFEQVAGVCYDRSAFFNVPLS